jgi:hypothetical protein
MAVPYTNKNNAHKKFNVPVVDKYGKPEGGTKIAASYLKFQVWGLFSG